jgi:hypothetical protein
MTETEIIYALSGLCFVLGFIALLLQKTYVDSQTNQPTEIELPLVGKLKSNFPALIFVVVGTFLAYAAWSKPPDQGDEEWTITGSFLPPKGETVNWQEGTLAILPKTFDSVELQDGRFEIQGSIPKGKKFEDVVTAIIYSKDNVSAQINVGDEYKKFVAGEQSLLKSCDDNSREYSPETVDSFQQR